MNTSWIKGPRIDTGLKGKKGGRSFKQEVIKVYTPRKG